MFNLKKKHIEHFGNMTCCLYRTNIWLKYDFEGFNAPSKIFPKLTSSYNIRSYVDIVFLDLIFKLLKNFYCQSFEIFSIALCFFRKQTTYRAPSNLLVQGLFDKIDASYNILEVGNVIFLCHCTKN